MAGRHLIGPVGWPARGGGGDPLAAYRTDGRRVLLTRSGRTAIDLALGALGLAPGDQILTPAYSSHCELDVLRRHRLEPVFYAVGEDFAIDLSDAARCAGPRVRALYVVHCYGVPQPAANWLPLARERGWAVIEDCAQALFASEDGVPVGLRGDFGIFSFPKTCGLPDGGFLLANRPDARLPERLPGTPAPRVAASAARQWLLGPGRPLLPRALAHPRSALRPSRGQPESGFRPDMAGRGPSWLTARLLPRLDPADIAARQRQHYARLLEGSSGLPQLRPLFGRLPGGANPICFPIRCERRDELQQALSREGIVTHRWWNLCHPDAQLGPFPAARALKADLLGLPVHYQLEPGDLDDMLRALAQWAGTTRRST